MAKELPYFKFEPSKWDNGNIQLCSFEAQGIFINLCCIYWSRIGDLPLKLAEQKLFRSNAHAYAELMQEEIFAVIDGKIVIAFLDEQLSNFGGLSETKAKAAKIRWDKVRENQQVNAGAMHMHSTSNAIREDKKREEEKKKDINNVSIDFFKIKELFNTTCKHITKITTISETREKAIKARIKDAKPEDVYHFFESVFQKVNDSNFLSGLNGGTWKASFDWILKKENIIKIIEGNYDNVEGSKQNGNSSQWANGATNGVQGPPRKQSYHVTTADFVAALQAGQESEGV